MPRSAPGPVMALPSSRMWPVVGVSSPATMRSNVDLPQPEGPRMVTKSLSATARLAGSSARVGVPPRTAGKMRETFSMTSLLTGRSTGTSRGWRP